MQSRAVLIASATIALFASGCSSSSSGVSGGYSGTVTDQSGGSGAMALTLVQKGSQVRGRWVTRTATSANAGNLTGSVGGNTITATLATDITNVCALTLNGTIAGSSIAGTYASPNCPTANSGSFSLQAAQSPANIAGSYSGTLTDSLAGGGSLSMSLTQNGIQLGGTYSSTYSNAAFNKIGPVYGFVSNSQVTIIGTPNPSNTCPFFGVGTLSGTTISGTYQAFQCSKSNTGTFTLTHQ